MGSDTSLCYLIGADGMNLVKIGRAKNPHTRLAALQVGSPAKLKLLASALHGQNERLLHMMFEPWRRHGEWFEKNEHLQRVTDFMCGGEDGGQSLMEYACRQFPRAVERFKADALESHRFNGTTSASALKARGSKDAHVSEHADAGRPPSSAGSKRPSRVESPQKFDRVAYQREYMRKRRAKTRSQSRAD